VTVCVVLDQAEDMAQNVPAYNQPNLVPHCSAVWANLAFDFNHEELRCGWNAGGEHVAESAVGGLHPNAGLRHGGELPGGHRRV
jgi:hypothetical protein